jgi:hypothetical protein
MAVKKADEYQHNNEDNAFVDSDFLRGGRRSVADRAALYALASKADQLKENVTIVRIRADGENGGGPVEVLLVDDTNIGTSAGWEIYSSGSSTPGTGGSGYSIAPFDFKVLQNGQNTFQLPAGTTGLDYPVQKQIPIIPADGSEPTEGETKNIAPQHVAFDAATCVLTVFAPANLEAGWIVLGTRRYGDAGGGTGGDTGGDVGTGDIDVNRLSGIVRDENLPPLTPEKVEQLTTLVNEENAQRGPFKLLPAALLDTPEDGALEYNGVNVYFTVGTVRKLLI